MSDPVTNPAVERVMGMVREWNHAVYLYNRHDNQNVSECDAKYEIIRAEIAAMVEEIEALKLEVQCKEATISMAVARLGDCGRVNFLQRIDRLVQTEREANQ